MSASLYIVVEGEDPGFDIFVNGQFQSAVAHKQNQPGNDFRPGNRYWSTSVAGMMRLGKADRLLVQGKTLRYKRLYDDFRYREFDNVWTDTAARGFFDDKIYVVQSTDCLTSEMKTINLNIYL